MLPVALTNLRPSLLDLARSGCGRPSHHHPKDAAPQPPRVDKEPERRHPLPSRGTTAPPARHCAARPRGSLTPPRAVWTRVLRRTRREGRTPRRHLFRRGPRRAAETGEEGLKGRPELRRLGFGPGDARGSGSGRGDYPNTLFRRIQKESVLNIWYSRE